MVMETSAGFDLPFLGLTPDLHLSHFSPEAGAMFNLSEKSLGKSISAFLGEAALAYFASPTGALQHVLHQDRHFHFQIYPCGKLGFLVCFLPEALRQAREALVEAETEREAKTKFTAMMTHDLRTPLGIIVSMTQIIQSGQVTPLRRQEYLENIRESAEGLLQLVNDILDYSKSEAGKLVLHEAPFDLVELVNHLKTSFRYKSHERQVRFAARIDARLPQSLISDEKRVRQIWYNLIDNAIKYTPEGHLVSFRVELLEFIDADHVRVRSVVSDQGLGIPKEKLGHLFEEFAQIEEGEHDRYSRRYGGVGLGLAIVKKMAELLGAELSVDSELGKGTKFTCDFVMKVPPSLPATRTSDLFSASLRAGLKVLLVEDHPLNQKVAQHMLNGLSCVTDIADSGAAALAKLSENTYDVILMDVDLPDMTGLEVTQKFHALFPEKTTPVIAVTANNHAEDCQACLSAGMQGFLVKPLERNQLVATIQRCLDR